MAQSMSSSIGRNYDACYIWATVVHQARVCDESGRELSEETLPTCELGLGEMSWKSRAEFLVSLESLS